MPAGVVAAEAVGRNSFALGLKENDLALGLRLLVLGRGGCPLAAGLADSDRPAGFISPIRDSLHAAPAY